MWTHERLKPKSWKGQPVAIKQQKYNGHRFTMYKQDDGQLVGFERNMRPDREITLVRPDIVKYPWWRSLVVNLPKCSSIDGELYVPNGNAGDATTAIANCTDNLEFMAFAMPWYNGEDLQHIDVSTARKLVLDVGVNFAKPLPILPTDTFESLCKQAVELEYEGWVLKQANYRRWYKVKPQKEVDCIVTGFVDGEGKYFGLVGSLKVSVYIDKPIPMLCDGPPECGSSRELVEIANVSGMDDTTRVEIDEEKDLGRVCEVEYQEVGNGGRLIHAHFVRWRDDKPANECVVSRIDL